MLKQQPSAVLCILNAAPRPELLPIQRSKKQIKPGKERDKERSLWATCSEGPTAKGSEVATGQYKALWSCVLEKFIPCPGMVTSCLLF